MNDGDGSPQPTQDDMMSSTQYALRCREFLELSRDLNNLGIDKYFDMPRITVIGGQSAGKSSLVEAVCGINVPRDSGTCTRCPIECSMSSNADVWSCQITLRYSVDTNGSDLTTAERASFGPPNGITDPESVELWLRRAQASILSPHMDRNEFDSKSLEELQDMMLTDQDVLLFSKNVIQVEIEGPGLTDLSFIDLPGLIQNSDAAVIKSVRETVESYISGQNTVILVAIPMSDDIENQQAVHLAKKADPSGERTIGVLTKPDTLVPGASGSRKRWMEILKGNQHKLKHGYYCVRLPDDDERARIISRKELSKTATDIFDSTSPWNTIPDRNCFGVDNLVSYLSKILVGLIEKNLPALKSTIDEQLRTCIAELRKFPAPVADPSTEFSSCVRLFCADFYKAAHGEAHKDFVQFNRKQYEQFKSDIYSTRPDFRPFEDHTMYRDPSEPIGGPEIFSQPPVDLREVQKLIDQSITWEFPNYLPFDVPKELVRKITDQWKEPSHRCFENIVDHSTHFIDKLVHRHFGRFNDLDVHICSVIQIELDKIKENALQAVDNILELETSPIHTQNRDLLASEMLKWGSVYTRVRQNASPDTSESESNHDQAEPGSTDDKFQQALTVMVDVRAYFQVAYQRIIDNIPLTIEHKFHQSALDNFDTSLFQSVPKGHDAMKALLSEDRTITKNRSLLTDRKERLTQIKNEFRKNMSRTRMLDL